MRRAVATAARLLRGLAASTLIGLLVVSCNPVEISQQKSASENATEQFHRRLDDGELRAIYDDADDRFRQVTLRSNAGSHVALVLPAAPRLPRARLAHREASTRQRPVVRSIWIID